MNHVMMDLETLDQKPAAVILSIGAVRFDPATQEVQSPEDGFQVACAIEDQIRRGFSVGESSLAWWINSSAEILRKQWAIQDRVPLDEALRSFARWLRDLPELDGFWSHGAAFDQAVLEHAYHSIFPGADAPWQHRQSRDTRTLFSLCKPEWPKNPAQHVAVYDAWAQAKAVCSSWAKLTANR